MLPVLVQHIDKLGRNVFFTPKNEYKVVVMNDYDPLVLPPNLQDHYATETDVLSTKVFWDKDGKTLKFGDTGLETPSVTYTQPGNYVINPSIVSNYIKSANVNVNIETDSVSVSSDGFGDVKVEASPNLMREVQFHFNPKLTFSKFAIRQSHIVSSTPIFTTDYFDVIHGSYQTVSQNETLTYSVPIIIIRKPASKPSTTGFEYYPANSTITNSTNDKYHLINATDVNQIDAIFDSVYYEFDSVNHLVSKTISFVAGTWFRYAVEYPITDLVVHLFFDDVTTLFDLGRYITDYIMDAPDDHWINHLPFLGIDPDIAA